MKFGNFLKLSSLILFFILIESGSIKLKKFELGDFKNTNLYYNNFVYPVKYRFRNIQNGIWEFKISKESIKKLDQPIKMQNNEADKRKSKRVEHIVKEENSEIETPLTAEESIKILLHYTSNVLSTDSFTVNLSKVEDINFGEAFEVRNKKGVKKYNYKTKITFSDDVDFDIDICEKAKINLSNEFITNNEIRKFIPIQVNSNGYIYSLLMKYNRVHFRNGFEFFIDEAVINSIKDNGSDNNWLIDNFIEINKKLGTITNYYIPFKMHDWETFKVETPNKQITQRIPNLKKIQFTNTRNNEFTFDGGENLIIASRNVEPFLKQSQKIKFPLKNPPAIKFKFGKPIENYFETLLKIDPEKVHLDSIKEYLNLALDIFQYMKQRVEGTMFFEEKMDFVKKLEKNFNDIFSEEKPNQSDKILKFKKLFEATYDIYIR